MTFNISQKSAKVENEWKTEKKGNKINAQNWTIDERSMHLKREMIVFYVD